ncbi:MAG: hypothetical protein N2422_04815 [Rhodobacteraceae bacterium]|nr:hypothetical protein [Paracoccaceae bacterium]
MAEASRPVLDLSGERLRAALADLVACARPTGGVERYVTALHLKASLFAEVLEDGAETMTEDEFLDLCAFMAPVRRRIGATLHETGFEPLRARIAALLREGPLDARMAAFVAAFPQGREMRWVRDLAAELLHFRRPEALPLMARWIWDARVGTGVLREIWHAPDVDLAEIDVPDDLETFVTLRNEVDGFLAGEGVFRDRHFYVDLIFAHVYAGYINDRGGQYLRNDFTSEGDPMLHTRRMLGLDAVDTRTGRTRLRLIDGSAHEFGGSLAARLAVEDTDAHP